MLRIRLAAFKGTVIFPLQPTLTLVQTEVQFGNVPVLETKQIYNPLVIHNKRCHSCGINADTLKTSWKDA